MCIILTCDKNVRPTDELIQDCFMGNPDGAGIMWVENGKVQVSKGFMTVSQLIRAIDATPADSPLVIHMRIATSGGIDVGTCHPFPVCGDLDVLHAPDVECDVAVAHNGVIKGMETDDKKGISDTVTFVSKYMTKLYRGKVTKRMRRRMRNIAPGNRFAVMTKDGGVYRVGSGWETVTSGINASNSTWRWTYTTFGSNSNRYYDYAMYGPEYEEVFDLCCGGCDSIGTCMYYGPSCEHVQNAIYAWEDDMLDGWKDGDYMAYEDDGELVSYEDVVAIA